MNALERFLPANDKFASAFRHGDLKAPPAMKVAVLTCMDARLQPEAFLGLGPGDAHVIRNAGGRVSEDVIRSLVISQQVLGTEEVVVVHHTDCGLLDLDDDQMAAKVREGLGLDAVDIAFLTFSDLEQSVLDDVEALASSDLIAPWTTLGGAIYDVSTGRLSVVTRR